MILVPNEGPLTARFVPIGEAPGPEEEQQRRPFIGPSGKILTDGALVGGLRREDMRICNVSPYRIYDSESDLARQYRRHEQVEALRQELAGLTEARTLLLIGAEAAEAVLGLCGPQTEPGNPKRKLTPSMFEYHGSTFTRAEALALQAWACENNIPVVTGLPPKVHSVVVVLHPAFALHGMMPRFKLAIQMVIARAAALSVQSEGPDRPGEQSFALDASPSLLDSYLALGEVPAVDVETPRGNQKHILICGIGTARTKVLVFRWSARHADRMRQWMARPGDLTGHNFLYDLGAFAAYGIRPGKRRRILDTIVACSLLQPVDDEVRDFPWLSLATCVARHVPGFYYWKESERTCQKALFRATYPWCPDELHDEIYNGTDVYKNSELWEVAQPLLLREGML